MDYIYNSSTPLQIKNTLCSLGLNPSIKGTKYLNQVIQYILKNNIEFIILDNIYIELSEKYKLNINTLRANINYALVKRNKSLTSKNFKRIFECEYDETYFEPKVFIELILEILSTKG